LDFKAQYATKEAHDYFKNAKKKHIYFLKKQDQKLNELVINLKKNYLPCISLNLK